MDPNVTHRRSVERIEWENAIQYNQRLQAKALAKIYDLQNELASKQNEQIAEARSKYADILLEHIQENPKEWLKKNPHDITTLPPWWNGELPEPSDKEHILEYKEWQEFLKKLHPEGPHPSGGYGKETESGEEFLIASSPEEVNVGDTYSIVGKGFGFSPGRLQLIGKPPDNNKYFTLTILSWSDIYIRFTIPEIVSGIPLNWKAIFQIRTKSGRLNYCPVTVQPKSHFCWSFDTHENKGMSVGGFSEEKTFYSSVLPRSYRQFILSLGRKDIVRGCVLIRTWDSLISTPVGDDAPVKVFLHGDAQVMGSRLGIKCTLKDDWFYNFKIQAEFFILTPVDERLPAGWKIV